MRRSKITAVISDVHFDVHDPPTWRAFRAWHAHVRPARLVMLGDMIDFGMLSSYAQHADAADHAIPQIRMLVDEANALAAECGELVIVEGNHDERWERLVTGPHGSKLRGALGLRLEDQCRFHGLDASIMWRREDTEFRGVQEGPYLLRHGHQQSGRFGVKHIAAARLSRTMGDSEIVGHHHRVQMMAQTSGGRTAVSIASGHMCSDQDYSVDANWQRGFTVIERCDDWATAYPIIIEHGRFAWGGCVFDGTGPTRSETVASRFPSAARMLAEIDVLAEIDAPAEPDVDVDLTGLVTDATPSATPSARTYAKRIERGWSHEEASQPLVSRGYRRRRAA